MPYNPDIHHRRSIRLQGYDYSQAGLYFVTICVQNRECLFGHVLDEEMFLNEYGEIVSDEWMNLPNHYPNIELGEFVVMPNHFHGIIAIVDGAVGTVGAGKPRPYDRPTLGNMIAYFKYQTTKQIDLSYKLWQRNYYEHIIRNANDYARIADYIVSNPAKWANDILFNKLPEARIVIPRHGKMGGKELLNHTKELLDQYLQKL